VQKNQASRLVTEPNDEAFATPKLNVVAIQEALGLRYCCGIVAADDGLKAYKMAVISNGISPVLRHGTLV
jgi:hypothetical protein